MYYDPWQRCKVDEETAVGRSVATRFGHDLIPSGWVHVVPDVERTAVTSHVTIALMSRSRRVFPAIRQQISSTSQALLELGFRRL